MTYAEYQSRLAERQRVVSANRSRRMRGLATLPLPEKPTCPKVPVAYEADGTYVGVLKYYHDCPDGCHIRWEPAVR